MISRLKEQVKAAKTKQDAMEAIHIEVQNLKIRLFNKDYKVKTSPGEPGPDFDEDLAKDQPIRPEDKGLVEYYHTVKGIKEAVDNFQLNKWNYSPESIEREFIDLLEEKPH